MKVLVVGGGIAGLSIAWRLAQAGHRTEIFESGRAGRGATWAAAGMLGAAGEVSESLDALRAIAEDAGALWPGFAAELQAASGTDIGFRQEGALRVALDAKDAIRLQAQAKTNGSAAGVWLTHAETRALVPMLAPELAGALYFRDEARVDNRALGDALVVAFRNAGGVLHELIPIEGLIVENNRVSGVRSAKGAFRGDAVVVAAGAWSGAIGEGLPAIRPAKGQMLALSPPEGAVQPGPAIWGAEVYLAARRGKLLLGATVEEAGFDTSITRTAQETLLANALRLLPALKDWVVSESWAGLRPRTPDDAPVLGPVGPEGLFVAGGQFRNGILLAPVIADALKRFVSGMDVGFPASAFSARRFDVP